MPRTLSDELCKVILADKISGSNIELLYRLPTTEERIKYSNSSIARRGKTYESVIGETRIKYGAEILMGLGENSFTKKGGEPLSSDPESKHFDPEWKSIVKKYASDVLAMLAVYVFENALSAYVPDEDENPT